MRRIMLVVSLLGFTATSTAAAVLPFPWAQARPKVASEMKPKRVAYHGSPGFSSAGRLRFPGSGQVPSGAAGKSRGRRADR